VVAIVANTTVKCGIHDSNVTSPANPLAYGSNYHVCVRNSETTRKAVAYRASIAKHSMRALSYFPPVSCSFTFIPTLASHSPVLNTFSEVMIPV
jgi:hypothetical protein